MKNFIFFKVEQTGAIPQRLYARHFSAQRAGVLFADTSIEV